MRNSSKGIPSALNYICVIEWIMKQDRNCNFIADKVRSQRTGKFVNIRNENISVSEDLFHHHHFLLQIGNIGKIHGPAQCQG